MAHERDCVLTGSADIACPIGRAPRFAKATKNLSIKEVLSSGASTGLLARR
jgi:hypothetical protein